MPISVFPERMDKLDPEDVDASLRTLETYVHYICERTEYAITNTFRTTTGLGSSAEAISLVLQEAVDDLSSLTGEVGALASAVNGKVDKVDGMGLSSNDYTDADKEDVDNIDALADRVTNLEEQGGEANVIEIVKRNGTALPVSGKAVDVTVPTRVSELTNDSGYQNAQQVQAAVSAGLASLLTAETYGPAAVVSFSSETEGLPLKKCQVDIAPVQAGSGDPSPTNIRAISGWTEANITVSPTQSTQDGKTHAINFPSAAGTVCEGVLDVLRGTLTVNRKIVRVNDLSWETRSNTTWSNFRAIGPSDMLNSVTVTACICSCYPCYNNADAPTSDIHLYNSGPYIAVKDMEFSSVAAFLAARGNEQIAYMLATPTVYQLTPQAVTALAGQNNVWADCGDVTVEYGAFLAALQAEIERLQEGGN